MSNPTEVPSVATEIYKLLEPLEPDARKRAVSGALVMLGEPPPSPGSGKQDAGGGENEGEYPPKAVTWMKQNGVKDAQLSQIFHEGELIANNLPGDSKKEKTISTYILCGIAQLLRTGQAHFDDTVARDTCRAHSCFDQANHANIIKGVKDAWTGSKKNGWNLTTPGLKRGADLVKQMVKG